MQKVTEIYYMSVGFACRLVMFWCVRCMFYLLRFCLSRPQCATVVIIISKEATEVTQAINQTVPRAAHCTPVDQD